MSLLSTTFFAGAVSKANSAIAGLKFSTPSHAYDEDKPTLDDFATVAAKAAFQELVNMDLVTLSTASAKSGLIDEIPVSGGLTLLDNLIVLACNKVVSEAMQLHDMYFGRVEVIAEVWSQNVFVSKKWKRVNSTDGVGELKSIDELNKENDEAISKGASNECEGGACKL